MLGLLCVIAPSAVFAQGKATLAREAAEYLLGQFTKESAEIGAEKLAQKIESTALRYGDETFNAVRKVGPDALRAAEEAGEHGADAINLMSRYGNSSMRIIAKKNRLTIFARYGDDAAEAMIKHGELVEPLLSSFGKPAAAAMKTVSSQNARRLAIMNTDGELAKIGRTPELLDVVGKYGDRAADFIWRNKAGLAVGAGLVAFLSDPEAFLSGTRDLAQTLAENTIKPLVEIPGNVASEAARSINWTFVVFGCASLGCILVSLKMWLGHRHHRRL
jgi:hypothetical protein